jgi:hypothetical protein
MSSLDSLTDDGLSLGGCSPGRIASRDVLTNDLTSSGSPIAGIRHVKPSYHQYHLRRTKYIVHPPSGGGCRQFPARYPPQR